MYEDDQKNILRVKFNSDYDIKFSTTLKNFVKTPDDAKILMSVTYKGAENNDCSNTVIAKIHDAYLKNRNALCIFCVEIMPFLDFQKVNITPFKRMTEHGRYLRSIEQKYPLFPKFDGDYSTSQTFKDYYENFKIQHKYLEGMSNDRDLTEYSFVIPITVQGERKKLNDLLPVSMFDHLTPDVMLEFMSRNQLGFANVDMNLQSTEAYIRFALSENSFKIFKCSHCLNFILLEYIYNTCSTCQMKLCNVCVLDIETQTNCNKLSFVDFLRR